MVRVERSRKTAGGWRGAAIEPPPRSAIGGLQGGNIEDLVSE